MTSGSKLGTYKQVINFTKFITIPSQSTLLPHINEKTKSYTTDYVLDILMNENIIIVVVLVSFLSY